MEFRYDTFCGLYCGACDVLQANKSGTVEEVAGSWGMETGQLRCHGCKSQVHAVYCLGCGIKACAEARKVEYCFQCQEYPCALLVGFRNDECAHHSDVLQSLDRLRRQGLEPWLEGQRQRWSCPQCGAGFTWYDTRCRACGSPVTNCSDEDSHIEASSLLPGVLAAAGLRFRPIHGEPDAEALAAVHAGRLAHDQVDPLSRFEDVPGPEELRTALSQAAAERRQDHWLVAQVQDQVVGYSQIDGWREDDGTWVYLALGWVLPEWRGQGIGTAMLHWAEGRIRRLAAAQHPDEAFEFAANASSTEEEATALLLHEGYRAAYTVLEMGLDPLAPLPTFPLPAGIDVRPSRPEHYALIAACIGEAYRHEYEAGRFQEDFDPAAYAEGLCAPKHDPALWQVAWERDQVVGQVLSIVENGRAEIFEISVRPAWRRRGLARSLLARALHGLRERGLEVIRIGTVAEFGTRAKDLYHSVGFRVLKEFPRYRKPAART